MGRCYLDLTASSTRSLHKISLDSHGPGSYTKLVRLNIKNILASLVLLVGCQLDTTPEYQDPPMDAGIPLAGRVAPKGGSGGQDGSYKYTIAGRAAVPMQPIAGMLSSVGQGGSASKMPPIVVAGMGGMLAQAGQAGSVAGSGGMDAAAGQGGTAGSVAGMGGAGANAGAGGSDAPATTLQLTAFGPSSLAYKQGDSITAQVAYRNISVLPYKITRLSIMLRDPDGGLYEMSKAIVNRTVLGLTNVSISNATLKLASDGPVGSWDIYPTYLDASNVAHDGLAQQIVVSPRVVVPVAGAGAGGSGGVGGSVAGSSAAGTGGAGSGAPIAGAGGVGAAGSGEAGIGGAGAGGSNAAGAGGGGTGGSVPDAGVTI